MSDSKIKYDYYNVDFPSNCAGTHKELKQRAIEIAKGRTKWYYVVTWTVKHISSDDHIIKFRVRRKVTL